MKTSAFGIAFCLALMGGSRLMQANATTVLTMDQIKEKQKQASSTCNSKSENYFLEGGDVKSLTINGEKYREWAFGANVQGAVEKVQRAFHLYQDSLHKPIQTKNLKELLAENRSNGTRFFHINESNGQLMVLKEENPGAKWCVALEPKQKTINLEDCGKKEFKYPEFFRVSDKEHKWVFLNVDGHIHRPFDANGTVMYEDCKIRV